jgi:maltose O-acetyltransferase
MGKTQRVLFEYYAYLETVIYGLLEITPPTIRKLVYKIVFLNFGTNVLLSSKFYVRYPWKVWIGNNVSIGRNIQIYPSFLIRNARVIISDGVVLAPNLVILGAGHLPEDPNNTNVASSVILEENVYVGANVTIRYGVTVGKNSVIAAGSVLVSNVQANSIYGGNPARLIRTLD